MSTEQSATPQSEQPSWYGETSFMPDEQVDFRKSDLVSVEILRARQAIAAAVRTAPSGTLEVVSSTIEKNRMTAPEEVHQIGLSLGRIRAAYIENNFDLSKDDKSSFGLAA